MDTMETTLNTGTFSITLFLNYNLALASSRLLSALQVQVQIVKATLAPNSITSTLHYQMVYQVQNLSLDLTFLEKVEYALIMNKNSLHAPHMCTYTKAIRKIITIKFITRDMGDQQ